MGVREIQVAGKALTIHELEDVCDSVTGRALTGSWVWGSALVLSDWIASQNFDFQDKTVLELGAGAGLPGLTAALLGAGRVVLTDIGPLLPGLIRNVEANGLQDRVEVKEYVWGSDKSPSQSGDLDVFNLVLMSDVFFNTEETANLAKTLKRVCGERKDTVVWAACEVRPWTAECLNALATQGFGVIELSSQFNPSNTSNSLEEESFDMFAIFQLIPPNQETDVEAAVPSSFL
ncbi:hypothetical protein I3843_11G085500 [Carya illinoinensis]|uniref:Uncharacterized protein n=1 Tax=Carya illinoinensis TaxID=32201 RepID=A0A922IZQ9_CARIL|nr:hypothetical protein I3760_11G085000 [Carya illinoinensis]KAG6687698.1 hypothetical protein I3842_11G086200 [Carya illinoinensis]KAG7955694.1 hypothetical protein I3843_11G085500 [Carya illinoinensis]